MQTVLYSDTCPPYLRHPSYVSDVIGMCGGWLLFYEVAVKPAKQGGKVVCLPSAQQSQGAYSNRRLDVNGVIVKG